MQKATKIILWIGIGIIVILLILLSLVLIFDLSWWWLFAPLIAITIIVIATLATFLIRKRHLDRKLKELEKPKEQAIDPEIANRIINHIALHEFAEYIPNGQEKITNEGSAGKPKTPTLHRFGETYWSGMRYYFLLNLNNTKIITKLFQEETETKEKFDERVKEAISKFAVEPETFETEEREIEPVTGRTLIRRKKQTIAEIQKEKEEKEAEAVEEI